MSKTQVEDHNAKQPYNGTECVQTVQDTHISTDTQMNFLSDQDGAHTREVTPADNNYLQPLSSDIPAMPRTISTSTPYTEYDYNTIILPHVPPNVAGEVHLPAVSVNLLPPGIPSKSATYSPISKAYPLKLEYSHGLGFNKQTKKARNWAEYKSMRIDDQSLLVQSPVGHLWTGDVTPLVHPLDATCTG